MAKKFFLIALVAGCLAGAPFVFLAANAADYGLNDTAGKAGYTTGDTNSVLPVLNRVVGIALSVVATVFFAMALYSGIRWMTARGQSELADKARNALESAVWGMVIVAASYALATFVIGKLWGTGGGEDGAGGGPTGVCCTGLGTGASGGGGGLSYCTYYADPKYQCDVGNTVPVVCASSAKNCCASIPGC